MTTGSRPRSAPGPGRGRPTSSRVPRPSAPPSTRRTSRIADPGTAPRVAGERASGATLTGRAAVLVLVLAVLAMSYASSVRAWLKQHDDLGSLSAQIATQRRQVAALEQAKRRWNDPAFIESQARQRFGWLLPGETGYRVIGANGAILSRGNVSLSTPLPASTRPAPAWWQEEWGSVVAAGQTPAQLAKQRQPARKPVLRIGDHQHRRPHGKHHHR